MQATREVLVASGLERRDPALVRVENHGVAVWTDPSLLDAAGVLVAFTERGGGVSCGPHASLNLADHVGDDPRAVDENRHRLLESVGLGYGSVRLVMAEQVHGDRVVTIDAGEYALGSPVPGCDALVTREPDVALLMCFADCVPVVLVWPGDGEGGSRPAVSVVHAGWRGALAGLPGIAVRALCESAERSPAHLRAYVGPHIRACHYVVDESIMSHFVRTFGTFARAESGGLDLGAVVSASLTDAGVDPCCIARLGTCTFEATDRFFSYRAEEGLTGRHGALACVLSP
ncbi:MAG: polyphenol oxidase family protein [Coriobacteriia bacterium]|nr:polyphenol oxidase family protein [Coriobacteriia bacterium]